MTQYISIEVVNGGFILSHDGNGPTEHVEVFVSQTKLIKKLKDLLDAAAPATDKE